MSHLSPYDTLEKINHNIKQPHNCQAHWKSEDLAVVNLTPCHWNSTNDNLRTSSIHSANHEALAAHKFTHLDTYFYMVPQECRLKSFAISENNWFYVISKKHPVHIKLPVSVTFSKKVSEKDKIRKTLDKPSKPV